MPEDLATSSSAPFQPPGETYQEPSAFDQFLDRNQKNLIILAILIALAAIGFVSYRGFKASGEKSAGEALSQAGDAASLKALIAAHSGTIAAGSAEVLLADKQWTDGSKDEAIATLKKFIADSPEHPAVPSAQASLGSKLAAEGKTSEATQVFEKLAANTTKGAYLAPFALISLGDLAKNAGQLDKAEEHYKRVQSDFPENPFSSIATGRLSILKAKPPVEIEGPATPPAGPNTDVPEMNLTTPIPPSMQLPIESSPTPQEDGTTPAIPGQP